MRKEFSIMQFWGKARKRCFIICLVTLVIVCAGKDFLNFTHDNLIAAVAIVPFILLIFGPVPEKKRSRRSGFESDFNE